MGEEVPSRLLSSDALVTDTLRPCGVRTYPTPQLSKLMRNNQSKGPPATKEALEAYALRVLRPGLVQSFGAVLLIASRDGARLTGAAFGTILAASENAEERMGWSADELIVGFPPRGRAVATSHATDRATMTPTSVGRTTRERHHKTKKRLVNGRTPNAAPGRRLAPTRRTRTSSTSARLRSNLPPSSC